MPPPRIEACDLYFAGKHVLVTGGSEGLGLALAARAVRGGAAAVTLVARTRQKLDAAAAALRREQPDGGGGDGATRPTTTLIQTFSADVTDAQALERAVRAAEKKVAEARAAATTPAAAAPAPAQGGVDVLVAAAGAAECGYFHEAAASGAFARQMELNYLGVVHAVQAVYAGMVERAGRRGRWVGEEEERRRQLGRRRRGGDDANPALAAPAQTTSPPPPQQHILIVASAMSLLNFVGYAAYSPSKWALRGLAEGLRNELQGSGLGVGVFGGAGVAGGASGSGGGANGSGGGNPPTNRPPPLPSSSFRSSSPDVRVTVAYPPDVDTPGYARESADKPPECAAISEGSPLYGADAVARCIARGMARNCFVAPNPSPVLGLLQALCRGVVPPSAGPALFFPSPSPSRAPWLLLRGWLALPLEMLLGVLGPLIASAAGMEHDGVARAMAPRRFAGLWAGGQGEEGGKKGEGPAAAAKARS